MCRSRNPIFAVAERRHLLTHTLVIRAPLPKGGGVFVVQGTIFAQARFVTAAAPAAVTVTEKDVVMAKHPSSEHHMTAAGHHAAAAHHHREAAHEHNQGHHEEAKQHSSSATEHSDLAHRHTAEAHKLSDK